MGFSSNRGRLQTLVHTKSSSIGDKRNFTPEQILNAKVAELLRKNAIEMEPMNDRECGFYRTFFLVPKKNGKMSPVINLSKDVNNTILYVFDLYYLRP